MLTEAISKTLGGLVEQYRRQDLLRSYGLKPSSKILFCGPPGCGKTVAAEAVAKALYLPLFLVRFDAVVSSFLGETAANLRKLFDFSISQPMVLLFDEFDAIGKHRMADDEHGEIKRVINSFLQMLDGYRGDALIIAATNHQGLLDPALWRRFDEVVLFDFPKPKDIECLIEINLRQFGRGRQDQAERHSTATRWHDSRGCRANLHREYEIGNPGRRTDGNPAMFDQQIKRQRERIEITCMQMFLEKVTGNKRKPPNKRGTGDLGRRICRRKAQMGCIRTWNSLSKERAASVERGADILVQHQTRNVGGALAQSSIKLRPGYWRSIPGRLLQQKGFSHTLCSGFRSAKTTQNKA